SQDEDVSFGVLARENSLWPGQLRDADVAFGGRFGLKEDGNLGVLAPEDGPWTDQLLEADAALGGRFELKEDVDVGVLAREDGPRLDQLLEAHAAFGGRFEPKFIPVARVPATMALTSELPSLRPAVALLLRGPFEPAMRPPK